MLTIDRHRRRVFMECNLNAGDITITAQRVTIDPAANTQSSATQQSFSQSGITLAVCVWPWHLEMTWPVGKHRADVEHCGCVSVGFGHGDDVGRSLGLQRRAGYVDVGLAVSHRRCIHAEIVSPQFPASTFRSSAGGADQAQAVGRQGMAGGA
jgi:hypothetical protein